MAMVERLEILVMPGLLIQRRRVHPRTGDMELLSCSEWSDEAVARIELARLRGLGGEYQLVRPAYQVVDG